MLYKINTLSDIELRFPNLNSNAEVLILIDKFAKKDEQTLLNEEKAIESAILIKETERYDVYRLNSQ